MVALAARMLLPERTRSKVVAGAHVAIDFTKYRERLRGFREELPGALEITAHR